MQTGKTRARLVLCISLTLLGALACTGNEVSAQEPDTEEPKTVAEQIEALVAELEKREAELKELTARVGRIDNEVARGALSSDLKQKRARFRREVAKLTGLVVQGADAGAETAEAKSVATRILDADAEEARKRSKEVTNEVLSLAQTTDQGSPEEAKKARSELSRRITESNELIQQFHENIQLREDLGLDVEADVETLKKSLDTRASFVAGYLRSTKEQIDDLASRPGIADDAEAQAELEALKKRRDLLADSQRLNVSLMDEYGLETSELRQGIISATGKLSEDVLDKDVAVGLIEEWVDGAVDWLGANGASIVFQVLIFLLILLAFWILARIGRGAVRRALDRSKVKMSHLAKDFFIKTTGRIIILLGVIIAIAQLGVEVGPLLAGLGIAGFVIGFALQDTLSNFAAGMMILVYRPFDVGDVIEAGGVMGKVDQMNLVSTMILTFDNQLLVVPNTQIWGGVIRNVTHKNTRRVDLTFGIGYSDDIPKAEKILTEIVDAHDKVLDDPAPVIRLHELGDSSVNFIVRPWSKTDDYWDVYWDITREVKRRFDEEGVSIPFPQRDVHIFHDDSSSSSGDGGKTQRSNVDSSGKDVAPGDDD